MAKVVRDKEMSVSQAALFKAISDFGSYPRFLPEVKSAKVKPGKDDNRKLVTFEIEIIKRFTYTLEFSFKGEEEIAWKLVESDFFKANDGKWLLQKLADDRTNVHYELDIGFGFFVPGIVSKKLIEVNLPSMFDNYEKRAKEIESKENK